MGMVDSSLGLKDTMPFGKKHKGKTIEQIFLTDAGYLMWLRDEKAKESVNPNTGRKVLPNREFFDAEVLTLLNATILENRAKYSAHAVWPDVEKLPMPDDTPFDPDKPVLQSKDFYNEWGAF